MKNLKEINQNEYIDCPVCGKDKLREFDVCGNCNWENDYVQLSKPDYKGGANIMSLNEARKAYRLGQPVI